MPWLKGWKKRVMMRIHPDRIESDLENFPIKLFIRRSSGRNKQDLTFIFDELRNDKNRKKIAVTLADGVTQCYVEIEKWNHTEKEAKLSVKVPKLSSTSTNEFYLYYDRKQPDNVSYVGDIDSEVAKNVWTSYAYRTRFGTEKERTSYYRYQKKLLELLFPKNWFSEANSKNHPAFMRWDLCNRLIKQEGIIKFPQQQNDLGEIGQLTLDSYILSQITGSNMKTLTLGALNYGRKNVKRKIRSRVVDANQFGNIMVELSAGAWHLSKGHEVTPLEEKGLPDLEIEFADQPYLTYIECKHLRTRDVRRPIDIVNKANSQIKRTQCSCYGAVMIDATLPVAASIVANDTLPNQVSTYTKILQSALSGKKNRSIGAALILWDDSMMLGRPPQGFSWLAFRRRFIRVNHTNPSIEIPPTLPLFDGWTTEFGVTWKPSTNPET